MKDSRHGQLELIREILGYLIEHPEAKDVPEGILKWWLPGGEAEWGKEDVQKALDSLTSMGWLIERKATPFYGINKDQLDEIREFLKGNQPLPE